MDIITRETDPPPWAICLLFDLCNIAQPFQQQLSSCSICVVLRRKKPAGHYDAVLRLLPLWAKQRLDEGCEPHMSLHSWFWCWRDAMRPLLTSQMTMLSCLLLHKV